MKSIKNKNVFELLLFELSCMQTWKQCFFPLFQEIEPQCSTLSLLANKLKIASLLWNIFVFTILLYLKSELYFLFLKLQMYFYSEMELSFWVIACVVSIVFKWVSCKPDILFNQLRLGHFCIPASSISICCSRNDWLYSYSCFYIEVMGDIWKEKKLKKAKDYLKIIPTKILWYYYDFGKRKYIKAFLCYMFGYLYTHFIFLFYILQFLVGVVRHNLVYHSNHFVLVLSCSMDRLYLIFNIYFISW